MSLENPCSSHLAGQLAPAEYVKVQMAHALAAMSASIGNDSVAGFIDAEAFGDFGQAAEHVSDEFGMPGFQLLQ